MDCRFEAAQFYTISELGGGETDILDLRLAGLSPDQIKKELHAAVDRTVSPPQTAAIQGSSGGHSEGEAAMRAETKKTLHDYGKKVGS